MRSVMSIGAVVLAMSAPGLAQQPPPTPRPPSQAKPPSTKETKGTKDHQFVTEAASGGMEEVELGKIGTEKASSDQVKQFGQRMVDDHGKANDELKALAQSKNITVPSAPSAKDQATIDKLSKLSGEPFDRAY